MVALHLDRPSLPRSAQEFGALLTREVWEGRMMQSLMGSVVNWAITVGGPSPLECLYWSKHRLWATHYDFMPHGRCGYSKFLRR